MSTLEKLCTLLRSICHLQWVKDLFQLVFIRNCCELWQIAYKQPASTALLCLFDQKSEARGLSRSCRTVMQFLESLLIFGILQAGCQLLTICGSSCNDDNMLYLSRLNPAYNSVPINIQQIKSIRRREQRQVLLQVDKYVQTGCLPRFCFWVLTTGLHSHDSVFSKTAHIGVLILQRSLAEPRQDVIACINVTHHA